MRELSGIDLDITSAHQARSAHEHLVERPHDGGFLLLFATYAPEAGKRKRVTRIN
jgi:hypothetical protein